MSSPNGAQTNPATCLNMFGSECDLKMHVQNLGCSLPLKIGVQNHIFRQLWNLTVNLTAHIFEIKHDRQSVSELKTTSVSYIDSKCHELWSTNGLKLDRHFYQPFVNSAFYFIARLRTRRSANGTQPNIANRGK